MDSTDPNQSSGDQVQTTDGAQSQTVPPQDQQSDSVQTGDVQVPPPTDTMQAASSFQDDQQGDIAQSSNTQSESFSEAPQETAAPQQDQQEEAVSPMTQEQQLPQQPSQEDELLSDTPQEGDYVANVGQSMIDLLTDISMSEELTQRLADTMRVPASQVTAILEGLLDKIDNEQITMEELALIITSPAAEEETGQQNPS